MYIYIFIYCYFYSFIYSFIIFTQIYIYIYIRCVSRTHTQVFVCSLQSVSSNRDWLLQLRICQFDRQFHFGFLRFLAFRTMTSAHVCPDKTCSQHFANSRCTEGMVFGPIIRQFQKPGPQKARFLIPDTRINQIHSWLHTKHQHITRLALCVSPIWCFLHRSLFFNLFLSWYFLAFARSISLLLVASASSQFGSSKENSWHNK